MKRTLRRNTEITETQFFQFSDIHQVVSAVLAKTNNGVGFMAFTIKSKLESKDDPTLAKTVLRGRLTKALNQYRKGGQVRTKLAVLIPAKSM